MHIRTNIVMVPVPTITAETFSSEGPAIAGGSYSIICSAGAEGLDSPPTISWVYPAGGRCMAHVHDSMYVCTVFDLDFFLL